MGLCQGKAAPIEPSSGPAPAAQRTPAPTPAPAAARATQAKVELTDDQINKWICLGKEAFSKRTWSDPNCSPDQVRQNDNKIREMRNKAMHNEKEMGDMMAMLTKTFNKLLPPGQTSLGWDEMKKMQDEFAPMHDKIAGGHWCWEQESAKAAHNYMASLFGSNGRVTCEQWMASFGPYMKKVQPYVECIELTPEQIKCWIDVTSAAYDKRKWSDAKCNPEQVKACNRKIQVKVAEYSATEEGMTKMMKQVSDAWDGLLLPGCDTLGWSEMRKMQFVYAPIHDEIAGGHWIWDEESAKAQFDYSVGLFGFNGRWTKTQWMSQFIPFMMYVKPTVEPNILLPEQAEEWVMLSEAADQASTWSNKDCTPDQVKEAKCKIDDMRKEMMKTEEGRLKAKESLMAAFKSICPAGQLTAGWEDMKKLSDYFAPMHDKLAGGHVCWDEKTAKAAFDFQVKKFGTGGRFSLTQWMASLMVFATEINPFVNPKMLTKEQYKEWYKVTKAAYEARKWSDSKCTPIQIKEKNEQIQHMRQELSKTASGREMIKNRMIEAFNSLLPAGKDSLGFDEMKHMQDIFAPTHDSLTGGHWIWEDKTSKANFDFMVNIFGEGGRVTRQQWMNSWIPYFRYVHPFVEEKNLEPEQFRAWVDLSKAAKAARTWSNKAHTPQQVMEADKKIEDSRRELFKTEEGRDKIMDSLAEVWMSLLKKGERTLGWDQLKGMQHKFAPMHDQLAGGHWIWDDKTSKAHFEFTAKIFGNGDRISFPDWMAQLGYYIKWIQPFVDTPTLTTDQATQWVQLSKKAFEARKWSNSSCTPAQVIEADNKIKAMRNELRATPEGNKKIVAAVYNAFAECMDKHTETCGWDELKKMGEKFGPDHDKLCGGHWIWDDATAKPQYEFGVAIYGSNGRYTFSQFLAQVGQWRKICEPLVEEPHLSRMQDRQWVNLTKKAKGAARWSNKSATREQIQECSRKFNEQFKANAADPEKGKEQLKMLSDMFDSVLKKDCQTVGWEETQKMRDQFYPVMDKAVGGHFIQEDTTAKAAFDFAVNIFGTDMRYTKSQWFAQIRYYMKVIEPFVETPILTPAQVQEWIKLGKAAMVARKWSDPKCTPLEVRQASKKIDDMRQEMRKTPQGNMKMFEALSKVFDELLPKDKDSLGWEEFRCMQDKFAPEHDKLAGGHWCWDDASTKASYDYGVNLFGHNGRYTKPQWFAQLIYYLRVVNPFVDPPQLSRAQAEEWLKLTKAALAARKWANPKCTPSMIRDCDLKIRANRDQMKSSKEGREAFMKRMTEVWHSLLPAGEDELGWEQFRKMQEIFAPEIDKINAPHQNAHWCWDDETAKCAYEYGAKIFGSPGCKYSLSQWFAMMISYDRYIQPFAEPKHLTKEQVQGWIKVQKEALEKRTWGNPKCTPDMIVDCDIKIRLAEDAMLHSVEGREKFGEKMGEIWQQLAPQGSDELGWDEMKKMQDIFAPEIDKINAPHENAHWCWEDASAKAAFEYSSKLYGSPVTGKFSIAQWFAMAFAYDSYVKPLVQPKILSKEQIDEWVKLNKEAMAARTWGNPKCTPQMVIDCDLKIRASRQAMRKTKEGREKFMNRMGEVWESLCPPGHDDLGWEEMKKMQDIFAPEIDKINAPHENAHWVWDDVCAKKAFDYGVKLFGTSHGTFTLPQWFAMMMSHSRNVEPFTEPRQISQEQINTWIDLTKKSLAARKWSVDGLTPEQIKAKSTEIQEGQLKHMDKLMPMAATAFQHAAGVNCTTVGWEGIKKVRDSFQEMDDKMFGGHFIWDDACSKAGFDFVVDIFGEADGKISFCQWAAQVQSYMKNVQPHVKDC